MSINCLGGLVLSFTDGPQFSLTSKVLHQQSAGFASAEFDSICRTGRSHLQRCAEFHQLPLGQGPKRLNVFPLTAVLLSLLFQVCQDSWNLFGGDMVRGEIGWIMGQQIPPLSTLGIREIRVSRENVFQYGSDFSKCFALARLFRPTIDRIGNKAN